MGKQAKPRVLADTEAKSVLRNLRVSPQKLNLVAAMIRGMDANKALATLSFSRRRIAIDVKKALQSAMTLGARVVHIAGHGHEKFMMFEDGHGGARALEPQALQRLVSAGAGRHEALQSLRLQGPRAAVAVLEHHKFLVAVARDVHDARPQRHGRLQRLLHINGDTPTRKTQCCQCLVGIHTADHRGDKIEFLRADAQVAKH